MFKPAITGTGVFTPDQIITNAELVEAFNAYVDLYNAQNAEAIAAGDRAAKEHSSEEFIFKASGIEQRYVIDKSGILNPEVMHPLLRQRSDDEPSLMAEMALDAATKALAQAGKTACRCGCGHLCCLQSGTGLSRRSHRNTGSARHRRLCL
jgi:beta-ketodecanoyl-[acyl-carrier-protein] synthase